MAENSTAQGAKREFPANWHIAADYDPNNHLMQLNGRDYLNVQNRLLWFIATSAHSSAVGWRGYLM
jgi:hypothetical protein